MISSKFISLRDSHDNQDNIKNYSAWLKTCFLTNLAGSGHICPSHFMTNVPFRLMKFRLYSSQLYSRISGIKTTILQVGEYLHQNTNMIFIQMAITPAKSSHGQAFLFLFQKFCDCLDLKCTISFNLPHQ